jgi:prepilin-type processing-associated H-X9-DG protein/prepilin-type N-terminal cleavage/methylation domain-containing protein
MVPQPASRNPVPRIFPSRRFENIRPSAFSLIEMMVVISVTALLLVLLLPIGRRAKAGADFTKCAANLRQMGMFFHLYAQDHDNRLPLRHQFAEDGVTGLSWEDVLLPYADMDLKPTSYQRAPKVYFCPSFVRADPSRPRNPRVSNGYATSYVCNGYILKDKINNPDFANTRSMLDFEKPSRTLLLADGLPLGGPVVNFLEETKAGSKRVGFDLHNGQVNVLMVDGSVQSMIPGSEGLDVFHTDSGRLFY